MSFRFNPFLAPCMAAFCLLSASRASADLGQVLPMGDLERWGIFTLGDGGETNLVGVDGVVQGDLGVAKNGDLTLSGNAMVNGDVYYKSNSTVRVDRDATITGSGFDNQNPLLNSGVDEARAVSDAAAAFASTRALEEVNLSGAESLSFTGTPGETVVLNLRCFKMGGNSTFTLDGAANTTYIINVKKQFSLAGHANIVLTGGLDWNDVLFNVRGKGDDILLSRESSFQGVLMANKRSVRLRDNAIARGEIIADNVQVQGSSQMIHPPVVSP
jgi:choice-of-anchor A domain-containing protein